MNIGPRSLIFLDSPSPAPSPSSLFSAAPPSLPSSSNPNFRTGYPSHQNSDYPTAPTFNGPYMGVVLVVLLVAFFLMASFSVYVRRYAFSASGEAGLGGDRSGQARGLDRAAIDRLPIVVYHCTKGEFKDDAAAHAHEWSRRPDCVVCLTDFQEAEKVRLLPKCEHCFHPECIDMWLCSHTTCPLCRRSLLPPHPPSCATNTDVCINVQTPPPPPPPPSSTSDNNSRSVDTL